jgi:hypothetical protein
MVMTAAAAATDADERPTVCSDSSLGCSMRVVAKEEKCRRPFCVDRIDFVLALKTLEFLVVVVVAVLPRKHNRLEIDDERTFDGFDNRSIDYLEAINKEKKRVTTSLSLNYAWFICWLVCLYSFVSYWIQE